MSNLKHRAFVSQGVSVTLGKLAECMSGCKTWSEVCKWNVKFQCPNTTEFFCVSPSWHWKWKMGESKAKNVSLCHRKSGSEMLSFGLASNQPFLDFFTSRNGWRTCLAHPSFSPALPPYIPVQKQLIWQTLWWQHSEWSTAQRACLRVPYQALLGPAALEKSDLWSDRLCKCKCNSYLPPKFSLLGSRTAIPC